MNKKGSSTTGREAFKTFPFVDDDLARVANKNSIMTFNLFKRKAAKTSPPPLPTSNVASQPLLLASKPVAKPHSRAGSARSPVKQHSRANLSCNASQTKVVYARAPHVEKEPAQKRAPIIPATRPIARPLAPQNPVVIKLAAAPASNPRVPIEAEKKVGSVSEANKVLSQINTHFNCFRNGQKLTLVVFELVCVPSS